MAVRTAFALFAPPTAWFIALNAGYFMVDWACGSGAGMLALHLSFLAMLLLSAAGGLVALRGWRRERAEWPGESADPAVRERFLLVIGAFGGVVFSAAILWFWVAAAVLDPCEPTPRLPFAPSARVDVPPPAPDDPPIPLDPPILYASVGR